jgi:hypothetical protein
MPLVSQGLYNPKLKDDATGWGRFGFERMIVFGESGNVVGV